MSTEQILTEQLNALNDMAHLLDAELDAIVARDHEILVSVVEKKQVCLQSIHQRDQHLVNVINDEITESEQSLIAQINQRLADCKKQNDVNQVAATQSQIASQKLKDILFGKKQSAYDKTGKSTSLPNPIARGIKA